MDFSASKNSAPENLSSSPEAKVGEPKTKEEQKPSKEVREAADVGKSAYVEAVGMDESMETTGKVSEVLGDTKEEDNAALGGQKPAAKVDPAVIKANLLKNMPTEAVMRKQIETEIKKEIEYLHKKAMKMFRSPGQVNYFEMNNLMKKIRELKGLLLALVKASFDGLKTLWLRFVHGIM